MDSNVKNEISLTSDDFDYAEIPLSWTEYSDEIYAKANTLALQLRNGNISIFTEYKNRVIKGCIPMRVDKFVVQHLSYIEGKMRLDYTDTKTTKSMEINVLHKSNDSFYNEQSLLNSTSINDNENSKQSTNLPNNSTTSDLADNSVDSNKTVCIPFVKNSNLCQTVKLKEENVMVRNTCAFDTLLHITVHVIGINTNHKCYVQNINYRLFKLALKIASTSKITINEYLEKALFLIKTDLFDSSHYTRRFKT
ncbi:hypothetical protein PUN28_019679 [Cardiocondyla obscurior]|uniref:Uncharacterized protein n=1 Tax=Cardiocondyla obscurior TaxID=286306 RepID=A0AAW2EDZ5_9HYME